MKIGFFDSGLGGLYILKATISLLPRYSYYYYGDTANLPYGDLSEDEVYHFTLKGVKHLYQQGCGLIIIACNTASAETTRKIQDNLINEGLSDCKVLGVIIPTVEIMIDGGHSEFTLIATKRTVESGKYQLEIDKHQQKAKLNCVATQGLVELIEKGELEEATIMAVKKINHQPKCLVLACTHYVALKEMLVGELGKDTQIISQDEVIPDKINYYLSRHPEIETKLDRLGKRQIHLTKHKPSYDLIMTEILGGALVD